MTVVSIKKSNHKIDSIKIEGHSGYAESGHDIICASVSTLVITSVNMMLRLDTNSVSYEMRDGFINIDIQKHSQFIDIAAQNMVDLLEELANDYKKYIKINK